MNKQYINQSEKYGEQVKATVADYQELDPQGDFVETVRGGKDVIVERNTNEVVAVKI